MALRTRLGLATVLTVGSLLLGGSQLSALAKDHGGGRGNANKVERVQAQAPDEVDEPDRVTGATRPGLGCGDDNHVHTGPPGNPDKECKPKHDDDSD